MLKEKSFLGIIPARGGSKRLPKKNILNLNGKPLIAWTIEAGLQSKYIDKVIVTSDDDEILDVSKKYNSDTIKRPNELATDTSTTFDAIKHTIENIENYDFIVLLQPTSPLRNSKHLDQAIELLEHKKANSIISVCKMEHNPLWSNTLPPDQNMDGFLKDNIIGQRSQDLNQYYRLNGAIYIVKTAELLKQKTLFIKNSVFAYEMDILDSIDIDEALDFEFAEFIVKKKNIF
jgi:CMP-N,N'-diacetyllegionaminic acid synthase